MEIERELGFRVVKHNGAWQIQHLDKEGNIKSVAPILYPELWDLWQYALDASGLKPSEA